MTIMTAKQDRDSNTPAPSQDIQRKQPERQEEDSLLWPWLPLGIAIGLLVGLGAGQLLTISGAQVDPKSAWYLSRVLGIAAYDIIWLSMVMGLLITSKTSRLWPGGPAAVDVHKFTSLLGVGLAAAHGVVLLGDHYINYSVAELAIPFASSEYRPFWTGLGQLCFYLAAVVVLSFYVRQRVGPRVWRMLHYLSFVIYCLGLIHGVMAGTDATNAVVTGLYFGTGSSILFLTLYRVLVLATGPRGREVPPAARNNHTAGGGR